MNALSREATQPPRYPPRPRVSSWKAYRASLFLNGTSMHAPDNTPSLEAVVDRWFRNYRTAATSSRPRRGRRERVIPEQGVPVVAGR